MFIPVHVQHDDNFLRIGEAPLREKVAEKLNEIEKEYGDIDYPILLQHEENQFTELIVHVKEQ